MPQPTIKQLIKKCKFDWVNEFITDKNFPDKSKPEPTELVHFNEYLSTEEVLKKIDEQGFRPATLRELLEFAIKNPDEQRKFPIAALGSSCVVSGDRHVLYLYGNSTGRGLGLYWFTSRWSSHYRFLVVRKSSDARTLGDNKLTNLIKDLKEVIKRYE